MFTMPSGAFLLSGRLLCFSVEVDIFREFPRMLSLPCAAPRLSHSQRMPPGRNTCSAHSCPYAAACPYRFCAVLHVNGAARIQRVLRRGSRRVFWSPAALHARSCGRTGNLCYNTDMKGGTRWEGSVVYFQPYGRLAAPGANIGKIIDENGRSLENVICFTLLP